MRDHRLHLRRLRGGRRDRDVPPGAGPLTRRTEQVGDVIQATIADLVNRRVKHPDLQGVILSFVSVEVTPDLAHAKVAVSILGDETQTTAAMAALDRVEPYLHRELGKQLHIRRVPRLHFVRDDSMAEADRITTLLRDVARADGHDLPTP
ncbi:MAG: 30S ribosome-binding factor RbfA [Dehalococcoidia bacterium]|nr:MAG: 30S ribosome-binding factor RbfA [Dehalococcoidia bacterium]